MGRRSRQAGGAAAIALGLGVAGCVVVGKEHGRVDGNEAGGGAQMAWAPSGDEGMREYVMAPPVTCTTNTGAATGLEADLAVARAAPPAPVQAEVRGVAADTTAGTPPASPPPQENAFHVAEGDAATSTFAVDVDTASYTFVRRFLTHEQLPPADLVRIEELVNTFRLEDPAPPVDGRPFAARIEVAGCPWREGNRLVRVSLRGREVARDQRPVSNLVFLIDVSGSMGSPERLPLLKDGLRLMVEQLGERDRVAIVVYAGASGLVLPPTSGDDKATILDALGRLSAGGSTNGGAGIQLAYRTAIESYVEGGSNRVVLCTDGDFNVGVSDTDELERLIVEKKKAGVFITCLGFGVRGGDRRLETLADEGDGHYAAIDDLREARRVMVDEMSGTLVTIAKDVKVQVAFDPERVRRWRLVGYENRVMANADFKDDAKDGGEIGAGHRVTALYEVEPAPGDALVDADVRLLTLRLRWKQPDGATSDEVEVEGVDTGARFEDATPDLRFTASVAAGGMLLRGSQHAGDASYARAIEWATKALGQDPRGERAEWVDLLRRAARLSGEPATLEPSGVGAVPTNTNTSSTPPGGNRG